MMNNMKEIYELIYNQYGHFYVCGDIKMAADVTIALEHVLQHEGKMSIDEARAYLFEMKVHFNLNIKILIDNIKKKIIIIRKT